MDISLIIFNTEKLLNFWNEQFTLILFLVIFIGNQAHSQSLSVSVFNLVILGHLKVVSLHCSHLFLLWQICDSCKHLHIAYRLWLLHFQCADIILWGLHKTHLQMLSIFALKFESLGCIIWLRYIIEHWWSSLSIWWLSSTCL